MASVKQGTLWKKKVCFMLEREDAGPLPSPVHRSTQRVFQILELVATQPMGLSFSQISQDGQIPKSSLSPLLATLTKEQYLYLDSGTKKYHIGKNLYFLGRAYLKNASLYPLLSREVQQVATQLEATTYLNTRIEGNTVYQCISETYTSVNVIRTPKHHLPAYATASGKALLSQHTKAQLEALYPEPFQTLTPHTLPNVAQLWKELEDYGKEGFYQEREESTLLIACIAVPIEVEGTVVAALSVAQHVLSANEERQAQLKQPLLEAKQLIERLICDHMGQWKQFCE